MYTLWSTTERGSEFKDLNAGPVLQCCTRVDMIREITYSHHGIAERLKMPVIFGNSATVILGA